MKLMCCSFHWKLIQIYSIHSWQLVWCQKHQINSPSPPVLHMGATSNYMSRFHQLFLGGFILPQNGLKLNFLRDHWIFAVEKTMLCYIHKLQSRNAILFGETPSLMSHLSLLLSWAKAVSHLWCHATMTAPKCFIEATGKILYINEVNFNRFFRSET